MFGFNFGVSKLILEVEEQIWSRSDNLKKNYFCL